MAKTFTIDVLLLVSAFCFSSLLGLSRASDHFYVEGNVYCDPCRVQFVTKLSHPLPGVEVSVICKKINGTGEVTAKVTAKTDKQGNYNIRVNGDHEDEICEVQTAKSSHGDCPDVMEGRDSNQIDLTRKSGLTSKTRYANSLGFMTKAINPKCDAVLKELGYDRNALNDADPSAPN